MSLGRYWAMVAASITLSMMTLDGRTKCATLSLDKRPIVCYIITMNNEMKTYQYNLAVAVAFGFLLIQLLDRLRVW